MQQTHEILGITYDQMTRSGLDLDVSDSARWLTDQNIDIDDRRAVEDALPPASERCEYDRFIDAVVNLARWWAAGCPGENAAERAAGIAGQLRPARMCCGCGKGDDRPDDPWEAYSVDRHGPDWMHASCLQKADDAVRIAIYPKTLVDDFMRTPPPEAAREYIAYATAWIDALDSTGGEQRWHDERNLRNAANVLGEDREALLERLRARERDVIHAGF